jgi:hypothetical protein
VVRGIAAKDHPCEIMIRATRPNGELRCKRLLRLQADAPAPISMPARASDRQSDRDACGVDPYQ